VTITTTLGALVQAEPALAPICQLRVSAKSAYHLKKLAQLVAQETKHFHEERDALIKALGNPTDGGGYAIAPDTDAFPCLRLAREAAAAGGTGPCVLNAANEVARHAFLGGRLGFMGIPAVIEQTLDRVGASGVHSFDSLYEADARAREVAGELVAVTA